MPIAPACPSLWTKNEIEFGLIGAMEEECALLLAQINHPQQFQTGPFLFTTGTLKGRSVVLLQSGIGKVNAAVGTTLMLQHFSPKQIINTGSAGGYSSDLKVGDIVLSTEVAHHDVDVTAFGYALGQVPKLPATFKADQQLLAQAVSVSITRVITKVTLHQGLLISGDSFIHETAQQKKIQHTFPEALAIDMEASAIAQTCFLFKVPFLIIRSISDVISNTENHLSFEEFLPLASKNSSFLIQALLETSQEKR